MNLQLTHKIILYLFILNLGYSNVLFTDITSYSGINFSGSSEGVCLFDYNNDGWDDIFSLPEMVIGFIYIRMNRIWFLPMLHMKLILKL